MQLRLLFGDAYNFHSQGTNNDTKKRNNYPNYFNILPHNVREG